MCLCVCGICSAVAFLCVVSPLRSSLSFFWFLCCVKDFTPSVTAVCQCCCLHPPPPPRLASFPPSTSPWLHNGALVQRKEISVQFEMSTFIYLIFFFFCMSLFLYVCEIVEKVTGLKIGVNFYKTTGDQNPPKCQFVSRQSGVSVWSQIIPKTLSFTTIFTQSITPLCRTVVSQIHRRTEQWLKPDAVHKHTQILSEAGRVQTTEG